MGREIGTEMSSGMDGSKPGKTEMSASSDRIGIKPALVVESYVSGVTRLDHYSMIQSLNFTERKFYLPRGRSRLR